MSNTNTPHNRLALAKTLRSIAAMIEKGELDVVQCESVVELETTAISFTHEFYDKHMGLNLKVVKRNLRRDLSLGERLAKEGAL